MIRLVVQLNVSRMKSMIDRVMFLRDERDAS